VKEVEENSSLFYNICVVDTQKSQGNENQRQKKKLNLFSNFFMLIDVDGAHLQESQNVFQLQRVNKISTLL